MPLQEYWWAGLGTILALSRDGTTPLCRNPLQATQTARKRADSHHNSPGVLPGVVCITLALAGSARVILVLVQDAVLGTGCIEDSLALLAYFFCNYFRIFVSTFFKFTDNIPAFFFGFFLTQFVPAVYAGDIHNKTENAFYFFLNHILRKSFNAIGCIRFMIFNQSTED